MEWRDRFGTESACAQYLCEREFAGQRHPGSADPDALCEAHGPDFERTPQRRVAPQYAAGRDIEQPPDLAVAHLADPPVVAHLARAVFAWRQAKMRPDVTRAREPSGIVDSDLEGE